MTPKLRRTLQRLRDFTDNSGGMYPGALWEWAPAQHAKLCRLGLATEFEPHNPIHKLRVVITEYGRHCLEDHASTSKDTT